jgi:hypothetical protein
MALRQAAESGCDFAAVVIVCRFAWRPENVKVSSARKFTKSFRLQEASRGTIDSDAEGASSGKAIAT